MMIFYRANLLVLAVPKTGTTALEASLAPYADIIFKNPPGLKHCNVTRFERHFQDGFEAKRTPLERVAILREPVAWLSSWYRYRCRDGIKGKQNAVPQDCSFDDFVQAWLSQTPPPYARIGQQARFISNNNGEIVVQHLFQYEQLDKAVDFLCARIGQEISLPKLNISPPANVELSNATMNRLMNERAREFAVWKLAHT